MFSKCAFESPTDRSAGKAPFILFIFFAAIVSIMSDLQAQTSSRQTANVSPAGTKFYLYTPPGYTASSTYPLLVYLHGGGDINSGNNLNALLDPLSHHSPPWLINQNQWPTDRNFIVLSPLLVKDTHVADPNNQEWSMVVVDEVLEYVKSLYSVNFNKIYFTGMSLGGAACWNYAGTHPDKVAGVVPFSGNTNLSQACTLASNNIPVWVFHGTEDLLVLPVQSKAMMDAVNACPAVKYKVHLNMLFGQAHAGWNQVYDLTDGYDIYSWLAQFSKGDTDNKKPFVSAGQDMQIIKRNGSLHLAGEYFDPEDGSIVSVAWSQVSGSPQLTLSNTDGKILKVDGLVAGTFTFRLTVTDSGGASSSDDVIIQIQPTTFSGAAVTSISLYNSANDALLTSLSEGMVINKNTLGINSYTLKATISNSGGSVWYSVNSDQRVYQDGNFVNTPGPYRLIGLSLPVGDYNVCPTSYTGGFGNGTKSVSLCYFMSVYDQPVKTLYPKPGMDISVLSNWGSNPDGSGTPPASFTDNFQNFNIDKSVMLNSALAVSGVQSNFYVKSTGQLTINSAINATINAEGNAVINVNTSQPITFGTLSSTSTVNFGAGVVSIPQVNYGNLILSGSGTLASETTIIAGSLTIGDNATVQGNSDNTSTLSFSGDLNINEDTEFNPAVKFGLQLTGSGTQTLNVKSTKVSFNQLSVSANETAELKTPSLPTTLELGSSTGGGLIVNNGGNFILHNHNLLLSQKGSLNSATQTGTLAVIDGTIAFNTTASSNSNLYLASGSNSVQSLTFDQSGAGALSVQNTSQITDFIKCKNGTIHSNGNLSLVSTASKTARIEAIEGNGAIEGSVEFQRFINVNGMFKYISFPVSGVKVSDVQPFIPVTGNFTTPSSGFPAGSGPSLFNYDEPNGGWKQFPVSSNAETFSIGKGYSIYLLQGTTQTTVSVKGPIQKGDFAFTLTGNPSADNNSGWNLIGNPYASPILWRGAGWTVFQSVNATAHIRDNNYFGGSRFLVWDGADGDLEEFGGKIAQGQSVWVRATGPSPQLTISESAKISVANATLWRKEQDAVEDNKMVIELKKDNLVDRTYLKFNTAGTDKFDREMDGVKQINSYFNVSTLSRDSMSLSINNLPDTSCVKLIDLSVATKDAGSYTLDFGGNLLDKSAREIYLVDRYRNTKTVLAQGSQYNFDVTADAKSFETKRFQIGMKTSSLTPVISAQGNVLKSNFQNGNQWMLNGQIIEDATGPSYDAKVAGTYQVRIADGNCGVTSDNFTVSITGIGENHTIRDIKIYPNPARNIFYVQGWSAGQDDIRYSIINLYGISLQQGAISAKDFQAGKDIQLSDTIQAGIYFLRLESEKLNYTSKLAIE